MLKSYSWWQGRRGSLDLANEPVLPFARARWIFLWCLGVHSIQAAKPALAKDITQQLLWEKARHFKWKLQIKALKIKVHLCRSYSDETDTPPPLRRVVEHHAEITKRQNYLGTICARPGSGAGTWCSPALRLFIIRCGPELSQTMAQASPDSQQKKESHA